jgi:hypothetical protein
MKKSRRVRLAAQGWRVGDAADLLLGALFALGVTPKEVARAIRAG